MNNKGIAWIPVIVGVLAAAVAGGGVFYLMSGGLEATTDIQNQVSSNRGTCEPIILLNITDIQASGSFGIGYPAISTRLGRHVFNRCALHVGDSISFYVNLDNFTESVVPIQGIRGDSELSAHIFTIKYVGKLNRRWPASDDFLFEVFSPFSDRSILYQLREDAIYTRIPIFSPKDEDGLINWLLSDPSNNVRGSRIFPNLVFKDGTFYQDLATNPQVRGSNYLNFLRQANFYSQEAAGYRHDWGYLTIKIDERMGGSDSIRLYSFSFDSGPDLLDFATARADIVIRQMQQRAREMNISRLEGNSRATLLDASNNSEARAYEIEKELIEECIDNLLGSIPENFSKDLELNINLEPSCMEQIILRNPNFRLEGSSGTGFIRNYEFATTSQLVREIKNLSPGRYFITMQTQSFFSGSISKTKEFSIFNPNYSGTLDLSQQIFSLLSQININSVYGGTISSGFEKPQNFDEKVRSLFNDEGVTFDIFLIDGLNNRKNFFINGFVQADFREQYFDNLENGRYSLFINHSLRDSSEIKELNFDFEVNSNSLKNYVRIKFEDRTLNSIQQSLELINDERFSSLSVREYLLTYTKFNYAEIDIGGQESVGREVPIRNKMFSGDSIYFYIDGIVNPIGQEFFVTIDDGPNQGLIVCGVNLELIRKMLLGGGVINV